MEWVEIAARTLEQAREQALEHLGVLEEDAEVQILEEPRAGLLGLRRVDARVRARVRPTQARRKNHERQGKSHARASDGRRNVAGGRGSRRRPVGEKDRTATAPGPLGAGKKRPVKVTGGEGPMEDGASLQEQSEIAGRFLSGVLDRFELRAEVSHHEVDEETVELRVDGDGLGLLIGPKGTTLAALQELTRTVVQRRSGGRVGRILVDVAGYRQKRRAALQRFSTDVAEDVRASGREQALDPMSPADRKVIHDTVYDLEGVGTRSEGEEPRRWVVIAPE